MTSQYANKGIWCVAMATATSRQIKANERGGEINKLKKIMIEKIVDTIPEHCIKQERLLFIYKPFFKKKRKNKINNWKFKHIT